MWGRVIRYAPPRRDGASLDESRKPVDRSHSLDRNTTCSRFFWFGVCTQVRRRRPRAVRTFARGARVVHRGRGRPSRGDNTGEYTTTRAGPSIDDDLVDSEHAVGSRSIAPTTHAGRMFKNRPRSGGPLLNRAGRAYRASTVRRLALRRARDEGAVICTRAHPRTTWPSTHCGGRRVGRSAERRDVTRDSSSRRRALSFALS